LEIKREIGASVLRSVEVTFGLMTQKVIL